MFSLNSFSFFLLQNGIFLLEILPGGMADKDGRLRAGDQIVDVMGTSMKDATYTVAQLALRQTLPRVSTIKKGINVRISELIIDIMFLHYIT